MIIRTLTLYYYTVGGIPLNAVDAFGFHVGANSRVAAIIRCGDTTDYDYNYDYDYDYDYNEASEVEELSQCSISISTTSSEAIAGVRCFEPGELATHSIHYGRHQ